MSKDRILYIVHCVDTEGPLDETIEATFDRLKNIFDITLEPTRENLNLIQAKKMDLSGEEDAVATCFSPALLKYNCDWNSLEAMLDKIMSKSFRNEVLDDFGGGWIYSWHCMDHVGYSENPRHKDLGYGQIFRRYKKKVMELNCLQDELNWHFHPLSISGNPLQAATSYLNNYTTLLQILCRRILDDKWFPVVSRPGFHSERPDSHAFLEQWIPFDYANQACEETQDQPDLSFGRFGDWSRSSKTWRGYHPSHDDYQELGDSRRLIFRCLNVGTRFRSLKQDHVREAFMEARDFGSAILSFANHDYRDMEPDVILVREMIQKLKVEYPEVLIKYAGAQDAAISLLGWEDKKPLKLAATLEGNRLYVEVVSGEIFGPQPFLAIKTREGHYHSDNFDVIEPKKKWTYVFDEHTIKIENILQIGVGSAGFFGGCSVVNMDL